MVGIGHVGGKDFRLADEKFFLIGGKSVPLRAANRTVAAWCQLTLRPWAETLGVETGDIETVEKHAERRALFEAVPFPVIASERQVPDALISDFHEYSDYLLAIAASSLDGTELFPGLGPVHRIIDRDPGRRTAIVVNSYEQVALIKAHLKRTSPAAHRVIGVTSDVRKVPASERASLSFLTSGSAPEKKWSVRRRSAR